MDTLEKLRILSDAAKYDAACTSSGLDKKARPNGIGATIAAGCCHSFAADGRCISLLKVLLTNVEKHHMALVSRPREFAIVPMEEFAAAPPDAEEARCRQLWRGFYDAIEIKPRHNERCRMTHLPKRYWKYMTEFAREDMVEAVKRIHCDKGFPML